MRNLELGAEVPDPLAPYLAVDRSRPRHECWVTGHMVGGLDGTAAVGGRVGPLSTRPDQRLFVRMRQIADVVLVGAETVRREGYSPVKLSEQARAQRREEGRPETPSIAIVSRSMEFDWSLPVFTEAPEHAPTLIITNAIADSGRIAEAEKHADVIVAGDDEVEPATALRLLAQRGHRVVLCEGGPTWLGELVAADRLDELCVTVAPLMGGDRLPVSVTPVGAGVARFELKSVMLEESTLFLRYESGDPAPLPAV